MRVEGFPRSYYCSLLLRDNNWFNTWASNGSVYRRRADRSRNVYCDIRVGSHKHDQVMNGGLEDNDEERESVSQVSVPIDDRVYDGLQIALWRLTETRFKEALADYNQREGLRISMVDTGASFRSFVKLRPRVSIKYMRAEPVDEERWVKFCKQMSQWMAKLPRVSSSFVEFDVVQETRVFVNTERSIIVQHNQIYSLTATIRRLTAEGSQIEQEWVCNTATVKELPDVRKFKKRMREKHAQLLKLIKGRTIHSFSGPVLLAPVPAGLMIHEAIGHRLEGSRLLASGEGQTLRGQIGKRIFNTDLTIRDNPKHRRFNSELCIGAYDFDDEGTPAQDALLVQDGELRGFLNTRAALCKRGFVPNGHARNKKYQRPISRMAVTIVEAKKTLKWESLKEILLAEIKRQKKPFGMIVYETCGGETDTTSYDFQGFSGEISYATLLYPDGREEAVRGVNFVGTPLLALNSIIGVGNKPVLENGYCGAESGYLPISTICPAILLRNLELQAKEEELVTQFILPSPR